MNTHINAYKIMWVFVMFDLPTQTKQEIRIYSLFRKMLLKDGFIQFQYSIYIRHCATKASAEVHIKKIKRNIPNLGHIVISTMTDKQFGLIQIFHGKKAINKPPITYQLELF